MKSFLRDGSLFNGWLTLIEGSLESEDRSQNFPTREFHESIEERVTFVPFWFISVYIRHSVHCIYHREHIFLLYRYIRTGVPNFEEGIEMRVKETNVHGVMEKIDKGWARRMKKQCVTRPLRPNAGGLLNRTAISNEYREENRVSSLGLLPRVWTRGIILRCPYLFVHDIQPSILSNSLPQE